MKWYARSVPPRLRPACRAGASLLGFARTEWSWARDLHPQHPVYKAGVPLDELPQRGWSGPGESHPSPLLGRQVPLLLGQARVNGAHGGIRTRYFPDTNRVFSCMNFVGIDGSGGGLAPPLPARVPRVLPSFLNPRYQGSTDPGSLPSLALRRRAQLRHFPAQVEPRPALASGSPAYEAGASLHTLSGHWEWSGRRESHSHDLPWQGSALLIGLVRMNGRAGRLRSGDLLHPKQAR